MHIHLSNKQNTIEQQIQNYNMWKGFKVKPKVIILV